MHMAPNRHILAVPTPCMDALCAAHSASLDFVTFDAAVSCAPPYCRRRPLKSMNAFYKRWMVDLRGFSPNIQRTRISTTTALSASCAANTKATQDPRILLFFG